MLSSIHDQKLKNHAPLLTGQLKAIAHPFYVRLDAVATVWLSEQRAENGTESGGIFPWTDDPSDDNHHAMANLGQLKAVFSLHFTRDADHDGLLDLIEHIFGTNPNQSMTFPGIPDAWIKAHFPSAFGFDPDGDPDVDGLTNAQEYALGTNPLLWDTDGDGISDGWENENGLNPNDPDDADTIGPLNLGFDEEIIEEPTLNFREAYPSDLYDQTSIPGWNAETGQGWQANEGQHIEVWDEGDEEGSDANPYVELQSHSDAHGVKQEFHLLPGRQMSFILRYKGRYEYGYDNAFDLKVEGASELLVDGTPAVETGSTRSHSFMEDDGWETYNDWQYASVSITAPTDATDPTKITLTLVPKTTTFYGEDGEEEITYGGFVDLLPVDLVAYEKDQVSNRIPNPKRPGYRAIEVSATPEETKRKLYNRLFISVEPESGNAEITVEHPIIPSPIADQFSIVITDSTGEIKASNQLSESGKTNIDFVPSGNIWSTISYVDMARTSGNSSNPDLLLKSYENPDGLSIQVAKSENIIGAGDALELVIFPVANGTAGSFFRTFKGTLAHPTGGIAQDPKTRTIAQEPPTMIAGSLYDQLSWDTEIRSFLLPDGSEASELAEGYFSKEAGFGLHGICRELMKQNTAQIWNDLSAGTVTSKVYQYPISPGTEVNFYYSSANNPKYTWGKANYVSGTVTLKLNKSGDTIVADEIKMQAEIEDYYDFDFTRSQGSFSNYAAVVQIGHEGTARPKGKVFHTVTAIDFSYNELTGALTNGGPPIPFFNSNGYIKKGIFVDTGGGEGGGNE